jgi:GNAT superfamily N-acetyltransferase
MRVEFIGKPERFVELAWPLLIADEAHHTHLLSGLQSWQRGTTPQPEPWSSAAVFDGDVPVAVARLVRRQWWLSLGPAQALAALGGAAAEHSSFDGAVGEESAARAFASACGQPMRERFALPLMRLTGAPRKMNAAGTLLAATADDRERLLAWTEAFRVEARLPDTAEEAAQLTERKLRHGGLWLWCDAGGAPVAFLGGQTIAPSGARIGPVYTPPQRRGQGIGAAMVAALSQRLLDDGARGVFLFTDATNATSNALYLRVGFETVGRHSHLTRVDGP